MGKKKVSQLSEAVTINDSDLIMIVQGGVSKKAAGILFLRPDTAATVLNLKTAAFKDVGAMAGKVAAGDHGHDNGEGIGGPFTLAGWDNSPVGKIDFFARATAPEQYLLANGVILARDTYPELWAEAQASGNLVTETQWAAGQFGSYSTGNGTTTFRIPYIDGYTIRALDNGRGIDANRKLGSAQDDAIQNITATFAVDDMIVPYLSGAFYDMGAIPYDATSSYSGTGHKVGFDASRVVRTAKETRMKNIALLACIKYQ